MLSQALGSTAVGPAVGAVEKFGRATGDAAAGMTGVPWAVQTGDELAEALARGGSGLPDFAPSAQAEQDKLQQLLKQRESLDQQRMMAVQERDAQLKGAGGRGKGRGPIYDEKDAEVKRLTTEMGALDRSIGFEQNLRDPNFQREQARLDKEAAAAEAKRFSEAPFREKYPAWAASLPNYGIAASMGVPALMGVAKNLRTFFPGSPTGRMRAAVGENEMARESGNQLSEQISRAELGNLLKSQPTMGGEATKAGTAAASGGALAAEASMYPYQYDAFNLPEGQAKDKAAAEALDWRNYAKRAGIGTATGLSGYKAGTHYTPARNAPIARAQSLVDNPPKSLPPPIPLNAAPVPQLPPPGGGGQAAAQPNAPPPLPPGMAYDVKGVPYDIRTGYKIPAKYFKPRS
jgi:hypothetical protein